MAIPSRKIVDMNSPSITRHLSIKSMTRSGAWDFRSEGGKISSPFEVSSQENTSGGQLGRVGTFMTAIHSDLKTQDIPTIVFFTHGLEELEA